MAKYFATFAKTYFSVDNNLVAYQHDSYFDKELWAPTQERAMEMARKLEELNRQWRLLKLRTEEQLVEDAYREAFWSLE